jgi:hypothetical protein
MASPEITSATFYVVEETRVPGGDWHANINSFDAGWATLSALDGQGHDLKSGEEFEIRYTINQIERQDREGPYWSDLTSQEAEALAAALNEVLPRATARAEMDYVVVEITRRRSV